MASRLTLHEKLCKIMGNRNVYFQPPTTIKLNYPCIIYHREGPNDRNADNDIYLRKTRYRLTVVDSNPDSPISETISKLRYAQWNNNYSTDGLNHFVYTIYI